ncbi:hypothetical protein D3C72_1785950 [compost metagenome]
MRGAASCWLASDPPRIHRFWPFLALWLPVGRGIPPIVQAGAVAAPQHVARGVPERGNVGEMPTYRGDAMG